MSELEAHDVQYLKVLDSPQPNKVRFPDAPAFYALYWLALSKTARECGYCLALHGSLQRDCDIVAVPWTEDALEAESLIQALCRHGLTRHPEAPVERPHGRLGYSLMVGGHLYFDVSVMPTKKGTP